MPASEKLYARISECPDIFGMSRATIYRGKDKGFWKIYKLGKMSLVKISEVQEAIESNAEPEAVAEAQNNVSTANQMGG